MYLRVLTWYILVHFATVASAQGPDSLYKSIHQLQMEHYSSFKPDYFGEKSVDFSFPGKLSTETPKMVDRKVIGWHPYWASDNAYKSYNYNALTHIAYFSYEVDTATGGYTTIRDWNSTPVINYAHNRGTRVLLTVTNFGAARNTAILEDTVKQNTLLTNVRNLLFSRNGDGVNFDFEALPLSQRSNMVSFMQRAERIIKSAMPEAELSIATPAVDWSGSWDLASLSQICDYIIIMGYDYYWRGSSTAGPVAPLAGENYNVTRTINTYLSAGVPNEKLVLAVPWYGYDWPVVSSARKSSATGTGTARFYTAAVTLAGAHSKTFDATTFVPWVAYLSAANWRQMWFDDDYSLKLKYELVKSKDIAGVGIWALSYEGGDPEIWDGLISSFSSYGEADDEILNLFPVPVHNIATVEFYLSSRSVVRLSLHDNTGRERMVIVSDELPEGYHSRELNMTGYASGMYICVLKTDNKRTNRRVIYIRQ